MNIMLSRLILLVIYLQRIIEESMQINTDFGDCNCSCICIVINHKIKVEMYYQKWKCTMQIDTNRLVIREHKFVLLTMFIVRAWLGLQLNTWRVQTFRLIVHFPSLQMFSNIHDSQGE